MRMNREEGVYGSVLPDPGRTDFPKSRIQARRHEAKAVSEARQLKCCKSRIFCSKAVYFDAKARLLLISRTYRSVFVKEKIKKKKFFFCNIFAFSTYVHRTCILSILSHMTFREVGREIKAKALMLLI